MLTVDDGIMRLRMRLNQLYGQAAVNLSISIGTEYQWGWSLHYQDTRPDHFLVGHGPVLFNKTKGELFESGSAFPEEYWVADYEYAIGYRNTYRLLIRKYHKSDAHLRSALSKSGVTSEIDKEQLPLVVFAGVREACEELKVRLQGNGVDSEVIPDHTIDPQRMRNCGLWVRPV